MRRTGSRRPCAPEASWLDPFPWLLIRFVGEQPALASVLRRGWTVYDRAFAAAFGVRPARRGGLLRYQVARWRGKALVLQDGTIVHRNDRIIRLHLDNPRLMGRPAGGRMAAIRSLATLAADLDALAERVQRYPTPVPVAVHAVTLHASLGRRLGFERRALARTPVAQYVRFVLVLLMALFHPEGVHRIAMLREPPWPDEIWLSASALLGRCEAAGTAGAPAAATTRRAATAPRTARVGAARAARTPRTRHPADPGPAAGRRIGSD